MQKNMRLQKVFYYLFFLMELVVFIYTLGFMTSYSDLFGLIHPDNAPIAEFHNVLMQDFNKTIFTFGVFGIVAFVMARFMEINKKIADKIAIAVVGVCFSVVVGSSAWAIGQLQSLQSVYLSLSFDSLMKESSFEHVMNTTAFSCGTGLYLAQIFFTLTFLAIIVYNHKTYLKKFGEVKA